MKSCRRFGPSVFFPLLLIAIGVIFLLDEFNLVSADRVFSCFWPAVIMFVGANLVISGFPGRRAMGALLLAGGGFWALATLGIIHARADFWWPLWLIGAGLVMLLNRGFGGGRGANPWRIGDNAGVLENPAADSTFDYLAVWSGVKRRITARNFTHGHVFAFWGGFNFDFTQADIAGDTAILEANCFMGGGEVRVPPNWTIESRGWAFMGGYGDETTAPAITNAAAPAKRLIIQGFAIMGGIVIKN